MGEEIKIIAKNKKQALDFAAKKLNVNKELISIKETFSGEKNLFGIYKKKPEFLVSLKEAEKEIKINGEEKILEQIEEKVENILKLFGILNFNKTISLEENVLHIKIEGKDLEFLTEDEGKVLNALQYLMVLNINNIFKTNFKVVLDCNNFREKRNLNLRELSKIVAEKVLLKKQSVTLKPMNAFERRLIHSYISQLSGVYSKSTGKGNARSVVIYPEKNENVKVLVKWEKFNVRKNCCGFKNLS